MCNATLILLSFTLLHLFITRPLTFRADTLKGPELNLSEEFSNDRAQ